MTSATQPRLVNIAIKADLESAEAWVQQAAGWSLVARHAIEDEAFLEARVGDTTMMIFARAVYERAEAPLPPGMLHTSYAVDALDAALADPRLAGALIWGPRELSGGFGRRRVAFFEVLPGVRIELMEELGDG